MHASQRDSAADESARLTSASTPQGLRLARRGRSCAPHPRIRRAISRMDLTPRQTRIVELVSLGMGPTLIAKHLSIAEATVRTHLRTTFQRLSVRSRVQLLAHLLRIVIEEHGTEARAQDETD